MKADVGAGRRVAYVARHDGSDMRVSKECNSLLAAGFDVTYIGWDRAPGRDRPDPMPRVPKALYRRETGFGGGAGRSGGLGFLAHLRRELRRARPHVVHCVNEDLAFVAACLRPPGRYRLVCDVFDSIALRWSSAPAPVAFAARAVARAAHAASDVILVTDEARRARLGKHAAKAHVVANYPVDPGRELAFALPPADGPVRLYVAGSLTAGRGLETVAALLEEDAGIEVVCAGWVYDEPAQRFVELPGVSFHGTLTPDASLRLAAGCDAIVALYAPVNENNRMASPNKVYDALCVGRPVIINAETGISAWVAEVGAGFVVPYGDVAALRDVVARLRERRARAAEEAGRLRELFETGYSWTVAEQAMLAAYPSAR
ncbi:MAG TPA: glycosyltransferase [Longimicrobium sp.]|nr:glycosyltransferase [Longimicrobium sp.]